MTATILYEPQIDLDDDRSGLTTTVVQRTQQPEHPLLRLLSRWPGRPSVFPDLMTPVEAAQYLRLHETGIHGPDSANRTLNYWRDKGVLKATKYARHVWYRKSELDRFLAAKTES
ncbi:MAG: helix-turn-helix domain-containing protein [Planctomycetes bacterium]|nr:helix-turn-helix domain-containing protein [Planctomycetota bacterium]